MKPIRHALAALLMAVTGLAVVQAANPAVAAAGVFDECTGTSGRTLSGTLEGEDGRFISGQVSIELFSANGTKLNCAGGVLTGAPYSAATLVNEKPTGNNCCFILPAEGSESSPYSGPDGTFSLEKTWSFGGIPTNTAYVLIETYSKRRGNAPTSTTARYGHSMRGPLALTSSLSGVVIRQPLQCGINSNGVDGSTGALVGDVFNNGTPVTPSRVSAFNTDGDSGNDGAIRSFNVVESHPGGAYDVDSLPAGKHTIFVTAAGKTTRFDNLFVESCRDAEYDIDVGTGKVIVPPPIVGVPVSGDWDGDGDDEPGIWVNGQWILRDDAAPGGGTLPTFNYGAQAGDQPVVGDWDDDGKDEPGIFRNGVWHLRSTADPAGATLRTIPYGSQPGDIAVPGDWDGDGFDEPGIYRPGGQWHFREHSFPGGTTASRATYGLSAGDVPVPGDWDGDGDEEPGIYRNGTWHARTTAGDDGRTYQTFTYGLSAGDVALKGNWDGIIGNGDGDEPAIYRKSDWHLRGSIGPQNTIYNYTWPQS